MTEAQETTRKPRRWIKRSIVVAIVLLCALSVKWYLQSDSFSEFVKARIVGQIEDATGGHVEIGALQWKLSVLEFDLRNVAEPHAGQHEQVADVLEAAEFADRAYGEARIVLGDLAGTDREVALLE